MARRDRILDLAWRSLGAAAVFALAWLQPVSMADADPALGLVAAQALVDHGSPRLDVYRDDPTLAYDLERDYRVRHRGERIDYYGVGVPLITAPAVAIARGFGLDMRRGEDEAWLGNLLSALACALVFFLAWDIVRVFLPPLPTLLVVTITQLGSPWISTLATGVWNSALSLPILLLAVRHMVRVETGATRLRWSLLLALGTAAYLCRPASVFLGFGVLGWAWARSRTRTVTLLLVTVPPLLLLAGVLALPDGVVPRYYDPGRIKFPTPLIDGLAWVLVSPSRGLLVYCPFLVSVAIAAAWCARRCRVTPWLAFALAWALPQTILVAGRRTWWGGHSFGPRLMLELLLPALVLTAVLARELRGRPSWRRWSLAYLTTGGLAVLLHAGLGLWNPATRAWNEHPNIDTNLALLHDWRSPQWRATKRGLESRRQRWAVERLSPMRLGDRVVPTDDQAAFLEGWSTSEVAWRWSDGSPARLRLRIADCDPQGWLLLSIEANANGDQNVEIEFDGTGRRALYFGPSPAEHNLVVPARHLCDPRDDDLVFHLPDAKPTALDPRQLGIAFRTLTVVRPPARSSIGSGEPGVFVDGWSTAEAGSRWSAATRAQVFLPFLAEATSDIEVVFEGQTLGEQEVQAFAAGERLASWRFSGRKMERHRVVVPARTFHRVAPILDLHFPDATPTDEDPRDLGLRLTAIQMALVDVEGPGSSAAAESDGPR